MDDLILYGQERPKAVVQHLRAGPIRLKFSDGELRYLHVGNKEIVRRVYFALRDRNFDTIMPNFQQVDVHDQGDSFTIHMEAICRRDEINYEWEGKIVGSTDGTIRFEVNGRVNRDFECPRLGICILYGTPSLTGHHYVVTDTHGHTTSSHFPIPISGSLIESEFTALQYTTDDGLEVETRLSSGQFAMEDQRNFCDSSYKAFHVMDHGCPQLKQGSQATETLVLACHGTIPNAPPPDVVRVGLGDVHSVRIPKLRPSKHQAPTFVSINRDRPPHEGSESLDWAFNPATHMPDDDTLMENIPSIIDQARTADLFAPGARIDVGPIGFNPPYPRADPDPRNHGLFAAAWCARMIKYLSLASVSQASFDVGPGPCDQIQQAFAEYGGCLLRETSIEAVEPAPVDALAIQSEHGPVIWLINQTDQGQPVVVRGVNTTQIQMQHINAESSPRSDEAIAADDEGEFRLNLSAFEVCQIQPV